ncbi:hypothetical protein [Urbifossiella limnaea]|uniref:Uncharacterized protein n=1 Tax=Urbifossiella limnaea TaxID=2528023 RepID=A0A517XPW5_9BACT|nr:hypothetical protein [Urbifossiella limnaea]QDU19532.1 hypothetical protein ETAA1_14610 [Urbifossiella limnaea]
MIVALLRRLTGGRPARTRLAPARFTPAVTALEGRDVPSAAAVPFHETLTLTGVSPAGVAHYEGRASHLGRVSADLNLADDSFVKTVASGDTLVGFATHASETTGTITYTGGTGRLAGTTGLTSYVISANPTTGEVTVALTGTLSLGHAANAAAGTHTVPFRINGTGPAFQGVPLFPGGSADHEITSGTATRLGQHTGSGSFTLGSLAVSGTGAVTGTFQGSFVFVAANGDRLAFTYGDGFTGVVTGQISADGSAIEGVVFDAVFAYDAANSTGRFSNLSGGSFRMIAQSDSIPFAGGAPGYTGPFVYSWTGEGTLDFTSGKKK